MVDLIIIGGGPAALSAASYSVGKGLNVALLYEKLGGKVQWTHSLADLDEERRLPGNEVVRLLSLRMAEKNVQLIQDHVESVQAGAEGFEVRTAAYGLLHGTAVIVATGATPLRLDVPGADRLIHHGLGYSIKTFGHLVTGKRIAVIGVTPRTLRGAAELARRAARVYLIAPSLEFMDNPLVQALSNSPNVEVLAGYEVTDAIGVTTLAGLRTKRDGVTRLLDVDHAFVDLGLVPNSRCIQQLVQTNDRGFVVVDHHNATSMPGLFAAGDITTAPGEQVLVAVGDGARAAMSAYDYLLAKWVQQGSFVAVT